MDVQVIRPGEFEVSGFSLLHSLRLCLDLSYRTKCFDDLRTHSAGLLLPEEKPVLLTHAHSTSPSYGFWMVIYFVVLSSSLT